MIYLEECVLLLALNYKVSAFDPIMTLFTLKKSCFKGNGFYVLKLA